MVIDSSKLVNGEVKKLTNVKLDLDKERFKPWYAAATFCSVSGTIKKVDFSLEVELKIKSEFSALCYKCGEPADVKINLEVNNTIDLTGQTYASFVDGKQFDLSEYVEEELILNFPTKVVCKENCLGLCGYCGKNLNKGKCNCEYAVDDDSNNPFSELKKIFKNKEID